MIAIPIFLLIAALCPYAVRLIRSIRSINKGIKDYEQHCNAMDFDEQDIY